MKILVTGGTGYIGSHTVVELQAKGYEVIIIDNLSNSHIDVLDRIEEISGKKPQFEQFDLADIEKTKDFFKRNSDISGIIHFAAFKAVGESVGDPLMYYRNNIFSLVNILQNMKDYGVDNIVFSSSCTVYGQPEKLPVAEDAPVQKAMSPYGNTKQISEDVIQDTAKVTNVNAVMLRYFNPIGGHESALIGELPLGVPNNLVPFITQTAIGIRKQLSVFGSDYNTNDGTAIRDYIHVVDLAKGHVLAIEKLIDPVEIYNLGSGNGVSVLELLSAFEKANKIEIPYKIVGRRAGDLASYYADASKAYKKLGWKTHKTILDMCRDTWKFEKSNKA